MAAPETLTLAPEAPAQDPLELVLMSRAELDELQRLRKFMEELPDFLDNVRKEACLAYAAAKLKDLHSREKENREKHRERSKKIYDRNREEICAKKRAQKAEKRQDRIRDELIERGELVEDE